MNEKCHFIGIGGIGMSGLAHILLAQKKLVSGSDVAINANITQLETIGAKVSIGHKGENITSDMKVIYSSDIKEDNPELISARLQNCTIYHRSDMLKELLQEKKSLVVTGTHGKTTTSALLAMTLSLCGLDPSYAVGGVISQVKTNAAAGTGKYFVAEGDESDGSFTKYQPFGAIITNIDNDHLNHFKTEENLILGFKQFISQISSPEHTLWCMEDPVLQTLKCPGISYGFSPNADIRAIDISQKGWSSCFSVQFKDKQYDHVVIPLTGLHNVLNALAVFGLCLQLGIPHEQIIQAFALFNGVSRRCEKVFEENGILILDDYAHHPKEIAVTLHGIRKAIKEKRIVAIYQPHRYSRTIDLKGCYQKTFDEADEVIITDIYAAGEAVIPGVTHKVIMDDMIQERIPCKYVPRTELNHYLVNRLKPHDVVVTLGAGDITKLGRTIGNELRKRQNKIKVGLVCGGKSVEHAISLVSAEHIRKSLNRAYYDVIDFAIDKEGKWECESQKSENQISKDIFEKIDSCDLLFPVLHGPYGEDGTIQGFFEIIGKPYVGCDHRSAAICMDKYFTKTILEYAGIATSPYKGFSDKEWKDNSQKIVDEIVNKLTFPLFVKPVHLGSSIGVKKATDINSLRLAVDLAFSYDDFVLVENEVRGREIEFAVFGNKEITVFPPGEILTDGQIYDYEGKYGQNSCRITSKADLSPELIDIGTKLVAKTYEAIGCSGYARIDTFLDENGKFWINEINPIPGFTSKSLYPEICKVNGLPSGELMDKFIILAMERDRRTKRKKLS